MVKGVWHCYTPCFCQTAVGYFNQVEMDVSGISLCPRLLWARVTPTECPFNKSGDGMQKCSRHQQGRKSSKSLRGCHNNLRPTGKILSTAKRKKCMSHKFSHFFEDNLVLGPIKFPRIQTFEKFWGSHP